MGYVGLVKEMYSIDLEERICLGYELVFFVKCIFLYVFGKVCV